MCKKKEEEEKICQEFEGCSLKNTYIAEITFEFEYEFSFLIKFAMYMQLLRYPTLNDKLLYCRKFVHFILMTTSCEVC